MTKRDFLAVEDWSYEEVEALLALAARVKRGEVVGGLERKVLAMVFLDPSLRTRTSFETGMFLHGGHAVVLEPGKGSWALETEDGVVMDRDTVEHVTEAARVLGRYADALAVRAFPRGGDWPTAREDAVLRQFARHCEKPVINLESSRRHPCQELADAFTLREKLGETRGRKFVLTWAWHPKALPTAVPVSAALAAARMGMDITIAAPGGVRPGSGGRRPDPVAGPGGRRRRDDRRARPVRRHCRRRRRVRQVVGARVAATASPRPSGPGSTGAGVGA